MTDTNERLMIVKLNIGQWQPRKFDRKASDELAVLHGSDCADDIGRFNKILVSLDSIKPLQKALGELRNDHYAMTAPWSDKGERVLPVDLYFDYCNMVKVASAKIEGLADNFCFMEYEAQRDQARARLNGLFNDEDYPSASDVRSKFYIKTQFSPLPNPEDARVWGIGESAAREIAAEVERTQQGAYVHAQCHVVRQLTERAQEFLDKIAVFENSDSQVLRETAVSNLRDICSLVTSGLNITGDQALTDMAAKLKNVLCGVTSRDLKSNPVARDEKVKAVKDIVGQFGGVFGSAS